ncbi:hypothetical protein OHA79_44580 (plasmid) [Streptomyces sp. NBC_00841]|uniref:hypothetical protein n=1 Tax=Streptomyces sp. NBC_00841 TaxID=2975847 RepID=UPI002DD8F41E|nr:hypothetical protein [Streptomyces sp. NBC_00841]WSA04761.1 hypothetical protein OHA79_44580 [Streptomyces sp. NBC_00841]
MDADLGLTFLVILQASWLPVGTAWSALLLAMSVRLALFTRTDSTSTSVREAAGGRILAGMFTGFDSTWACWCAPR